MFLKKDKIVWAMSKVIKIVLIFVLLLIWILIWRLYEKITNSSSDNFTLECPSPLDAFWILDITEVSPLWIKWKITSWDLRIVAWKEAISWKDINFELSTANIFRAMKFVSPDWAKFFASKKWKKLYNISDEKALDKITPNNIIFFKTLDEAKKYWYKMK